MRCTRRRFIRIGTAGAGVLATSGACILDAPRNVAPPPFTKEDGMTATLTPDQTKTDRAEILDLFRKYRETIERRDADGWLALWTEEGVQMPPASPALHGKAAIAGGNVDYIRDYDSKFVELRPDEIEIAGDWGYSRGTYILSTTPRKGGDTTYIDGKYLSILKRQADGSWKIHRDCFNSNV